jgi:hypothetical protein
MVIPDNQESIKEESKINLEILDIILLAKIIMIIEVIVEVTIVTIIEMIIGTIIAIGRLGILIIAMEVEIMIEENINQGLLIEPQINIDQIIMAIQGLQENINQGLLIGPQTNIDQIIMAIQGHQESINQGLLIGPQKVLLDKITIGHQIHIVEIM